jgi:hypothetical protein
MSPTTHVLPSGRVTFEVDGSDPPVTFTVDIIEANRAVAAIAKEAKEKEWVNWEHLDALSTWVKEKAVPPGVDLAPGASQALWDGIGDAYVLFTSQRAAQRNGAQTSQSSMASTPAG